MLTELDPNTIANITAALDYVCNKIPPDKDSHELRKRIADELIRSARMGTHLLIELKKAGSRVLKETTEPPKSSWFGFRRR